MVAAFGAGVAEADEEFVRLQDVLFRSWKGWQCAISRLARAPAKHRLPIHIYVCVRRGRVGFGCGYNPSILIKNHPSA